MPIVAEAGQEYVDHETGTFPAVCVAVLDMGLQKGSWKGEERIRREVWLYFDTGEPGSPLVGFYTLTLSPKSRLRADLEAWRGKPFTKDELGGFDVSKLAGHPCTLTIAPKESGKVGIVGVGKAMRGVNLETDLSVVVVDDGGTRTVRPDYVGEVVWDRLIEGGKLLNAQAAPQADVMPDDEIPF